MKIVQRFQTIDGREFASEDEAIEHDTLAYAVRNAVKPLGKEHPSVEDGKGWVQHSPATVLKVKIALLQLAKPLLKHFPDLLRTIQKDPASISPMGVMCRILSDYNSPINEGWNRLACIDEKGREHQQPYFAINGPKPNQICVEDRR